jgi:hypothetical protein
LIWSPDETIELGGSELGGFLGGSLPPTIFLYSCHYPIFSNPDETIELGGSELGSFLGGSLPPTIFLYSRHYPIFSNNPNLISCIAFFFFFRQLFESNFMNLGKFFEGTRDSSPSLPPPPTPHNNTIHHTNNLGNCFGKLIVVFLTSSTV